MTQFSKPIIAELIVGKLVATELDIDNSGHPTGDRGRVHAYLDLPNLEHQMDFYIGEQNILDDWGEALAETVPAIIKYIISSAFGRPQLIINTGRVTGSDVNASLILESEGGGSGTGAVPRIRLGFSGFTPRGHVEISGNTHKTHLQGTPAQNAGWLESESMRPIENSSGVNVPITSASYVGTNESAIVFVAPPSGAVRVDWHTHLQLTLGANVTRSAFGSIEVRTGGTLGGGSVVTGYAFADGYSVRKGVGATSGMVASVETATYRLITGLTPGDTYHVRFGYRVDTVASVTAAAARRHMLVTPCT